MKFLLQSAAASTLFSMYSILIKRSGLNWWAAMLCMGIGYLVVAVPVCLGIYFWQSPATPREFLFRADVLGKTLTMPLILSGVMLGLLGGMQNGGGHVFYQQLIATPLKDLSTLTILIPMLCLIAGFVVAIGFNGEQMTRNKAGALVAAGVAIWLASKN